MIILVDYLNPHWRLKIRFCLCKTYSMSYCHVLYVLILFSLWVFFFFLIPFVLHVLYHLWFFKRCNSNKFFFFNKNYHHQIWSLPQKSWKYWSNKSSKMIGKMILSIYLKLALNPRDAREILSLFLFIYYLLISERRNKYMELISISPQLKIL